MQPRRRKLHLLLIFPVFLIIGAAALAMMDIPAPVTHVEQPLEAARFLE